MRIFPTTDCGTETAHTKEQAAISLRGHILVIPGLGLSPLGEFCIDAVVSTFGLTRKAIIQSRHLIPLVMASAWQEQPDAQSTELGLTTAAELYQSSTVPGLSVLQLRSAVVEGHRQALVEELWAWACEEGVVEFVIASSCSSHVKVDQDLAANTNLRYVQVGGNATSALEAKLGPNVLPLGHAVLEAECDEGKELESKDAAQLLRGAGLARLFLSLAATKGAATDTSPPNVLCLVGFTTEVLDWQLTHQLTDTLCAFLAKQLPAQASAPNFQAPPSWRIEQEGARLVQPIRG